MAKPITKKLKNGMTAVFVPQKGAESMTLLVLCHVGSRFETKKLNGASHFIEHLMFKGTKKRPSTEMISRELDRYGAEYNAFTDKDLTAYYIKMDAAKTPLAVDMLHDMLFNSKFDAKEMDRERGVIVEEINMYEDNPRMHIGDILEEALYPDSTLGWNIAGPRSVIRSVTRDELIGYRDAYYIPERMAVVLSGKIVPNAEALLEKTFGSVKRPAGKDASFKKFVAPKKIADPIAFQDKQTEQVQFAMAFHGLAMEDPRLPATNLLASILGGSMSSRLFIQIRERRGLCYSVSASHDAREDVGAFCISAGLEKARFPEAVAAIVNEVKKVLKTGVTEEELQRAKDHIRGRLMLAFEDSAAQADWYGRQWIFKKKLETPDQRMVKLEQVTRADIKNAAKAIFRPEAMAAAVIGPFKGKEDITKLIRW